MRDSSESSAGTCAVEAHHSVDSLIREAGFVIASRPEIGQAKWRRRGVIYLHGDALAIARREWKQKLEALEAKHGK